MSFRNELHKNILKAVIKTVENHKDSDVRLHQQLKEYFAEAKTGMQHAMCFCPDNARVLEILEMDLENAKEDII